MLNNALIPFSVFGSSKQGLLVTFPCFAVFEFCWLLALLFFFFLCFGWRVGLKTGSVLYTRPFFFLFLICEANYKPCAMHLLFRRISILPNFGDCVLSLKVFSYQICQNSITNLAPFFGYYT